MNLFLDKEKLFKMRVTLSLLLSNINTCLCIEVMSYTFWCCDGKNTDILWSAFIRI